MSDTATTEQYGAWLRAFRFQPYCPICRCLRYLVNCRSFNHFGARGYDYEHDQVIYDHDTRGKAT